MERGGGAPKRSPPPPSSNNDSLRALGPAGVSEFGTMCLKKKKKWKKIPFPGEELGTFWWWGGGKKEPRWVCHRVMQQMLREN